MKTLPGNFKRELVLKSFFAQSFAMSLQGKICRKLFDIGSHSVAVFLPLNLDMVNSKRYSNEENFRKTGMLSSLSENNLYYLV